jgi:hypothetical protein
MIQNCCATILLPDTVATDDDDDGEDHSNMISIFFKCRNRQIMTFFLKKSLQRCVRKLHYYHAYMHLTRSVLTHSAAGVLSDSALLFFLIPAIGPQQESRAEKKLKYWQFVLFVK